MDNKRSGIRKFSANYVVLAITLVVGVVAFIAAIAVGNAQKPATVQVLVTTRDLNVGDVISAGDVATATVYKDAAASYYITADQQDTIVGGWVAIPILQGQPITRQSVIAEAGVGERLSASLAKYGKDYRLFTIPLDAQNIVSPGVAAFMPGDLIGVTMTVSQRPQGPATPTPTPALSLAGVVTPTPASQQDLTISDALGRIYPPFAADLFPEGLRVMAVYGKASGVQAVPTTASGSSSLYSPSASTLNQPTYLIVLVPQSKVEELSLALMGSDKVYISMMAVGSNTPTTSFSYWDLEDLLKQERNQVLGGNH